MVTKTTPMYVTLILAYSQENLHKIIGENTVTVYKLILLDHGKDTKMIISYFGNAHEGTLTIYITYSKTNTQE